MNSVAGLFKPECWVMLTQGRFYAMQPRWKKQPKFTCNEPDGMFKEQSIQTSPTKNQNVNCGPQRVNEFNVQMLSDCLYKQIYNGRVQNKPDQVLLDKAKKILRKYGLGTQGKYQSDIELKLPKLRGDIEEHFWNIGNEQSKPYQDLVEKLMSEGVPERPEVWVCQSGWTKYTENKEPMQVQYPDEDVLVMDVEVCVKVGQAPIIATAVSSKAWYGWVSPCVFNEKIPQQPCDTKSLIQLVDSDKPSLVIGHFVSFDRAHIRGEYNIKATGLRFLDTMALHISMGKFTSKRHVIISYITLKELYQFYCNKILNKEKRSVFLTGGLLDVKTNFQNLMEYCANDSKATFEILEVIFPQFLKNFPHPVTLAGMLEMGIPYLPVNRNWRRYVQNSSHTYEDLKDEMLGLISRKVDDTCKLIHNNEYKNDLWMWGENWSTQTLKLTKKKTTPKEDVEYLADDEEKHLHDRFKYLFDLENRLPKNKRLLGYPHWYRVLYGKAERLQLSSKKIIMPKILRVKSENFPLYHMPRLGWGILIPDVNAKDVNTSIPFDKLKVLTLKNLNLDPDKLDAVGSVETYYNGNALWCNLKVDNCCYFHKLQNNRFPSRKVANIFSKNFTLLDTSLSSDDITTKRVLRISEKLSFWVEFESSVKNEMVVWLDDERGVILPWVAVCGTISRQAMEKLWMKTAPDNAIGSELRSMVQAPAGYHIVGGYFDLDLWIVSLLGDSIMTKIHGATPLSWVTYNEPQSNVNSIIAKKCNLPERQAEFLTRCRLKGNGVQTMERCLKKLNPQMKFEEVRRITRKIYSLTKGMSLCKMKNSKKTYRLTEARKLSKTSGKVFDELFFKPFWYGGIESSAHNMLQTLITAEEPATPFLSSRLCEALDQENIYPKRFGSMVQSCGVDFLHLMLVCMRWLTNGKARYCFSFHDEVRYLIPSKDRYNGALALQVSSLLVKAFCSHKLGMYDLPLSGAFFPTVGVDTTLRREVRNDYITPSNPHGLEKGYGIAPGEALDIYEAIEKSGGSLKKFCRNSGLS